MPEESTFAFNINEQFPNLPHAPIHEAVIQFQGRAEAAWNEKQIIDQLRQLLPDYRVYQSERTMQQEFRLGQVSSAPVVRDLGWIGVKFMSLDKSQIVSFGRDSFSFSRLRPYASWEQFITEALRLWPIHQRIAQVSEVSRLGVRFINQVAVPKATFNVAQYFTSPPAPSAGLKLHLLHFFQNSRFAVPGYPYAVNVIRAVQPSAGNKALPLVILDVDVFITNPFAPGAPELQNALPHFRWLKNKMFFDNFTPETIASFR